MWQVQASKGVGEGEGLGACRFQPHVGQARALPGQSRGLRGQVHSGGPARVFPGEQLEQEAVAAGEVQDPLAAGHPVAQELVAGPAVRGAAVAEHFRGHRGAVGVEGVQEGFLRCGGRHGSSLRMPGREGRITVET